jgi:SAM-dependent methyltransferase
VEPAPADLVASGYDAVYASWNRGPTLRRIWRELAAGPGYPEEFRHISFLTGDELALLAEVLGLGPDGVLVDLACGAGGPGLWVTRQSGARLTGVDLSAVALLRAVELADTVGLRPRAEFVKGSFEATGLAAASADAAMCVDALQYAPSKAAAFTEAARALRPGGRMAFVAFELEPAHVAGLPVWGVDPVADYRRVLEQAGFTVVRYEETPGWRERVTATFEALVAERAAVEAELGVAAAAVLALEASLTLEQRPYRRRILAVADRS